MIGGSLVPSSTQQETISTKRIESDSTDECAEVNGYGIYSSPSKHALPKS